MAINVGEPIYLLLLLPALALLVWWWRTQLRVRGAKRYVIAGFRGIIFLLLVLVLAKAELNFPIKGETVVFVVDRSFSVADDPKVFQFLREAISKKKEEDQYAIVSVAQEAVVEQPLTTREELGSLGVVLNQHATNLAAGIRLGQALIPSHARGKLVLITDGLETEGDVLTELKLVKERGIKVEAVPIERKLEEEALVTKVELPERLFKGEAFHLQVEVESTMESEGVLYIYEENREVARETIRLAPGKNTFLFPLKTEREGFQRYRVELEVERDTIQMNNQGFSYTQVEGAPKVLIIEGEEGDARNLAGALRAGNIEVEVISPQLLPRELAVYKEYASIVLANVEATQVSTADQERIRTAVRDLGIGLVMTGGEHSFGLGGWFKTPVEEALPVSMELKSKEEIPSLALVLVIDKSSSMSSGLAGPNKMELAKEAALRATDLLQEQDQISVVAFDSQPWVVVELQPVTNLKEIQERIGSIFASGGTDIYTALVEGYHQAKKAEAQRKHVILLTDGQSGYADYASLIEEMIKEKITVSTVAIGDDADTFLLEEIAGWGQGRYYFANDPASLPQIVSKETALASRTFVVEDPHIPLRTGGRDLSVLGQELPLIHAYLATSPKLSAEVVLESIQADPILARWQYGLGRSVAWTSDLNGQWAPLWVNWEAGSQFWNQLVAWTFPQQPHGKWQVNTALKGATGQITVDLPNGANLPQQLEAVVIRQNLEREVVPLKPVQPGRLEGEFSASVPGSYLIQVLEKDGDRVMASETSGINVAYSPEYRLLQGGEERLQGWMEVVEGKLLHSPQEVFTGELPRKYEKQDISHFLLLLVALLWPIDIAIRRLQFPAWLDHRFKQLFKQEKELPAAPSAHVHVLGELEKGTSEEKDEEQHTLPQENKEDPFSRLLAAKEKRKR